MWFPSCLKAGLWLKPIGLVQRSAATWHRFCVHRVNRVNSRSGSAMMTALQILSWLLLLLLLLLFASTNFNQSDRADGMFPKLPELGTLQQRLKLVSNFLQLVLGQRRQEHRERLK